MELKECDYCKKKTVHKLVNKNNRHYWQCQKCMRSISRIFFS